MRLNKFINRIDEKVSKKEINDILKDTNVMVGVEIEFILEDLNKILRKNRLIYMRYINAINSKVKYTNKLKKWFKLGKDKDVPQIPKDLIDYDLLYMEGEGGFKDLKDGDKIPNLSKPNFEWDIESDDFEGSDGEWLDDPNEENDTFVNYMKMWVRDNGFPFGKYKIGFYGDVTPKIGDNFWAIEPDSSLGSSGIEVKSPVVPLKEFIEIMPNVFDWIKKHGRTTESCGFHVNMSIKGINNLKSNLDLYKLIVFLDEEYIYKFFSSRKNNDYAESLKQKILKGGIGVNIDRKDIKKIVDNEKIKKFINFNHHDSITFEGLNSEHPDWIEFRYLGGSNYHKKWSNIKPIVARYAYYLNIAVNPNYKKKEYIKKLLRLLNKIPE